jgi:hypothetical protein
MDSVGFDEESLIVALSHLVDHKAQRTSFVGMVPPNMVLCLRTYLAKYYYTVVVPWGHGGGQACIE